MTEKELSLYNALKTRIERNEVKLEDLRYKDIPGIAGTVKGSSKNFPYIEKRFTVEVEEPNELKRHKEQMRKIERDIVSDRERVKRIEEFISEIDDLELQQVFEMRIYEEMGWNEIAGEFDKGKSRTTYSRNYKRYIENAHNAPIAQNNVL